MRANHHFVAWATLLILIISTVLRHRNVHAFVPSLPSCSFSPLHVSRSSSSSNSGRRNHDDEDEEQRYQAALAHNKIRTDVKNFLTQRAIQSFIFLLVQCRDPHTVRWMENTYEFRNMESYHGTGAFNLTKWKTWDSILDDMLHQPKDCVIVQAKRRGKGHGGWSANNPYLEERFVEFRIDIDPVSLASRILSVREQIAREWMEDLVTLRTANDQILDSYYDMGRAAREDESSSSSSKDSEENVEQLVTPYSGIDEKQRRVFDRNAMLMLTSTMIFKAFASSPQRQGNFDLLYLLLTQESLHRVLREYRESGDEREVSYEWLKGFYLARVGSFFDGHQDYGRADDFLEELLLAPPSTKELSSSRIGLIDPLRIAEDIITMRSVVAEEWKTEIASVPEDHMGLRKKLLSKQMGSYDPLVEQESSTPRSSLEDENDGVFQ
ncbi:hypothetical protein FisN_18Lh082 [Fistulifera solaris]|uniref:Uncharacterized protein n=1 Tax=Fistulifera solaris TaxID=1519565 RepID=A0A1Z5KEZ6_FISSO|nr:hypothetical protein FisN_18Lh082 [Fistulifera solaris]|eukprot:GAX24528.1 hypothetical protein FisN_18Lh082 [Fistulifera solaris]